MMLISLSACANPEVVIKREAVFLRPPAELLSCQNEPEPPTSGSTRADVRDYISDLVLAYRDCRAKVDRVRHWSGV